jgi:hypothetical protein
MTSTADVMKAVIDACERCEGLPPEHIRPLREGVHPDDLPPLGDWSAKPPAWAEESYLGQLRSSDRGVLIGADVPPLMVEYVLQHRGNDRPNMKAAIVDQACRAIEKYRSVFLHGLGGTGKTITAIEALRRNGEGFFVRAVDYVTVAKRNYANVDDRRMMRRAERTSFLVLDDVGEEAREHSHHIARLLTTRFDRGGRTILTANCDKQQFATRYKDRVVDRWRHNGISIEATEVLRPDRLKKQRRLDFDDSVREPGEEG